MPGGGVPRGSPLRPKVEPVEWVVPPPRWEAGRLVEVFLVEVESCNRSRAAIHVLVVAPEGIVNTPLVEAVGDDADAMAAIEPNDYAVVICRFGEALDVEELSAYKVDTGEMTDTDLVAHRGDNVLLLDGPAVTALHGDEVLLGVPAL